MGVKYKKSKYDIFLNQNIIYNLLSRSFIQVNEDLYNYLKTNNDFTVNELGNVFNKLVEYNIISQDNELSIIDYQYNRAKFAQDAASYIIYPTLLCNFDCHYCFETNKKSQLDDNNTEILKKFLSTQAESLRELKIRWSGGEPLLVWKKIKLLTTAILENAQHLQYNFSMATNGYYLNEIVANELYDLHFSDLQITIDGTQAEHNKIRFTATDKDTYSKIIDGIKIASKIMPIRIRFNVYQENKNSFPNFLDELEKRNVNNENIEIFVKPILSKQDSSCSCGLLDDKEFFEQELKLCSIAEKKGFKYSMHPNFRNDVRCLFHQTNSFVIDPDLSLYKCALDVGLKSKEVGKINSFSKIEISDDEYIKNCLSYSPITMDECRNCKVLPICYGKCPLGQGNHYIKDKGCIPEKKSIKFKLNQFINNGIEII
ncbi:MAG: SPASM domain-containing protein [Prevotellaceae bacterium]|jgi:uncharacterized protein|nr:SPASM domain-containing protein [Prevotellaceae bacterium]